MSQPFGARHVLGCLDIETYGSVERNASGKLLPTQRELPLPHRQGRSNGRMDPFRALHFDGPRGLTHRDLVVTCAITLPQSPTPLPASGVDGSYLAELKPGPTMVYQLPRDINILARSIAHLQVLCGWNIQFDLVWLRHYHSRLRHALSPFRHLIIDGGVLNNEENPLREERSLKNVGSVLGTHTYEKTLTSSRFPHPHHPDHVSYNAQDTHNTLTDIAVLSRRILARYPSTTHKLTPYALRYYSDLIHTVVHMTESGVPHSATRLETLFQHLNRRVHRIETALAHLGLYLTKDIADQSQTHITPKTARVKCNTTKSQFLDLLLYITDAHDHPHLAHTEVKGEVSWSEENLSLLASLLPPLYRDFARICRACTRHAKAQKLLSSYAYPYTRHRRTEPRDRTSTCIPHTCSKIHSSDCIYSHPSWFLFPSPFKDNDGASGGTQQCRITCKNASHQTDPPTVEACRRSRYRDGYLISYDADQLELRPPVLFSGDANLAYSLIHSDPHTERTIQIYGRQYLTDKYPDLPADTRLWKQHPGFSSLERQIGKMVGLADSFRSGPSTLQAQIHSMCGLSLPLDFLTSICRRRSTDRPQLWAWQESIIKEARTNGYLCVPFIGTHRFFLRPDEASEWDENEIVNFPIQAFSAAVINRLAALILRRLTSRPSNRILLYLNVYDALKFDAPAADINRLDDTFHESVYELTTSDLWHLLSERTGHTIPLTFSRELKGPHP